MFGSGILCAVLLATEFTEKIKSEKKKLWVLRVSVVGFAGVAELADAHDSKSCSVRSEGSSPSFGTGWVLYPKGFLNRNILQNSEDVSISGLNKCENTHLWY